MVKNARMQVVREFDEPGVIFVSETIGSDILEYGEFRAAITENVGHHITKNSPYSLAIVVGAGMVHLAIIKRKLGLSGGGVAVASYGTCEIEHVSRHLGKKVEGEIKNEILCHSKEFGIILNELCDDSANKGDIIELIYKYIHLSSPTFRTEGNMLFSEDAEKLSTCIFLENDDPVAEPIFKVNEDDLIYKDLYMRENGILIEDIGGHVRYVTEAGRTLDIINVNRKDGESALGVDLIYYMREFRSIVMLQYKRITSGVYYTSQDHNYLNEIGRMDATRKHFDLPVVDDDNLKHKYFRLSSCPFYFKLCPDSSSTTNRFVTGACVHIDYWNALMLSERCRTSGGNCRLGYDELEGRHLTSMEFINLTKRGLLGGHISGLKALAALIKSLKLAKHMVVASVASPAVGYSNI